MSLEHLLVGLCREPSSGYDLKSVFDDAIRHFWSAELSQIYSTLHRLDANGMLDSKPAPSMKGPQRRIYHTTPAGKQMLREWLEAGPAFRHERNAFVAQVFLLDELDDLDATAQFIVELRGEFESRRRALAEVEGLAGRAQAEDLQDMSLDEFHHYLTLRMGLQVLESRVAWCVEALQLIQTRKGET